MKCPNCDTVTDEKVCPDCGATVLSVPDATLDQMIQDASIPNLAAMFKRGQDAGLIKPVVAYASTTI
jgi:hypothetical protein